MANIPIHQELGYVKFCQEVDNASREQAIALAKDLYLKFLQYQASAAEMYAIQAGIYEASRMS